MDTLHPDLDAYLASLSSKGGNTVRARRADLVGLSRWWEQARGQPFAPGLLAERDVQSWIRQRQVEDGAAPATINRALSTGRRCWTWLLAQGRARENPFLTVTAVPQDPPAPRKLDRTAVDALLRAAADEDNITLRRCNEALLALLGGWQRFVDSAATEHNVWRRCTFIPCLDVSHRAFGREVAVLGDARDTSPRHCPENSQRITTGMGVLWAYLPRPEAWRVPLKPLARP